MYKEKTFLAIIPARGGSKGIPNKNIVQVNGKPLIEYTFDEVKKSKYLDRVIVSTDSEKIKNVAIDNNIEVPFLRPANLAADTSKTIDSIIYTVDKLQSSKQTYDYIVILQPTQPLRKHWHIDEAIEKIIDTNEESLVSISEVNEHPILMRTLTKEGLLKSFLDTGSTVRRQDFSQVYKVNGAIYINKNNNNYTVNSSLNDNKSAYIMDKEYDIDIDDLFDLNVFSLRLKD